MPLKGVLKRVPLRYKYWKYQCPLKKALPDDLGGAFGVYVGNPSRILITKFAAAIRNFEIKNRAFSDPALKFHRWPANQYEKSWRIFSVFVNHMMLSGHQHQLHY